MSDILNNLEKLVKAGFGAASEGLDQAAKAVEKYAEKGEPAYNQAREAVSGAVDSLKKALTEPDGIETAQIKDLLRRLPREALDEIEAFIAGIKAEEAPREDEEGAAEEKPEEDDTNG